MGSGSHGQKLQAPALWAVGPRIPAPGSSQLPTGSDGVVSEAAAGKAGGAQAIPLSPLLPQFWGL